MQLFLLLPKLHRRDTHCIILYHCYEKHEVESNSKKNVTNQC